MRSSTLPHNQLARRLRGVLAAAIHSVAFVSCSTPPETQPSALSVQPPRIELQLLSPGVSSLQTTDPHELFKRLRDNGLFSYYVDRNGVKIDIESRGISTESTRSSTEFREGDLSFTAWKVTSLAGEVSLIPFLDTKASYGSRSQMRLTVKGRSLCVTPRYVWYVSPEYDDVPPGVIQDVYLVADAELVDCREVQSSTSVDVNIPVGRTQGRGKIADIDESVLGAFMATHKNAILGNYQTTLPASPTTSRLTDAVDFERGSSVAVSVFAGRAPLTLTLIDIDPDRLSASFSLGTDRSSAMVPISGYRTAFDGRVAIQFAESIPGDKAKVRFRVHTIDELAASKTSVVIRFKSPQQRAAPGSEAQRFVSMRLKVEGLLQSKFKSGLPFDDGTLAVEAVLALVEQRAQHGDTTAMDAVEDANSTGLLLKVAQLVQLRPDDYVKQLTDQRQGYYGVAMLCLCASDTTFATGLAQAQTFYRKHPDDPRAAFVMGYIFGNAGETARASEIYRRLQQTPGLDPRIQAMCYVLLADELWESDGEAATLHYIEALRLCRQVGWMQGELNVLLNLVNVRLEHQHFDTTEPEGDVESILRKCMGLALSLPDSDALSADIYFAYARLYRLRDREGDKDAAIEALSQAKRRYDLGYDQDDLANCRAERALQLCAEKGANMNTGIMTLALQEFRAAASAYARTHNVRKAAYVHFGMMGVLSNLRRPLAEVRASAELAIQLFTSVNNEAMAQNARDVFKSIEAHYTTRK